MNNTEIGRYYQELFDLQDKVAVVIGGSGVLCGELAGGHSIRVNDQWRICFRWKGGDADDVEIVDYH